MESVLEAEMHNVGESGESRGGSRGLVENSFMESAPPTDPNLTQELMGSTAEEIARMLASAGLNPANFLDDLMLADAIKLADPIAHGDDRAARALVFGTGGVQGISTSAASPEHAAEETLEKRTGVLTVVLKSADAQADADNLSLSEKDRMPEGALHSEPMPTVMQHNTAAPATFEADAPVAVDARRALSTPITDPCLQTAAFDLLPLLPIDQPAAAEKAAQANASLADSKFNRCVRDHLLRAVGILRLIGALKLPASRLCGGTLADTCAGSTLADTRASVSGADVSKLVDALALKWGAVSTEDAVVGGSLGSDLPRPSTVDVLHVLPFIERLEQQLRPGVATSLPLALSRVRSVDRALQSDGRSIASFHHTNRLHAPCACVSPMHAGSALWGLTTGRYIDHAQ
jgi:hypothetical protein